MLELGPLAFAAPAVLTALLLLPLIWWILRISPPSPRLVRFPAIRLLFGLRQDEETPAQMPWWLLLLRLLLAAVIILALAQPLLNPSRLLPGAGPVLLVLDDGWAAARHWPERQQAALDLLQRAGRADRPVALLTTAPQPDGSPPRLNGLMRPEAAASIVQALVPKPWPTSRSAVLDALGAPTAPRSATVYWISDGVASGSVAEMATSLQRLGRLDVLTDAPEEAPRLLRPPTREGTSLVISAERLHTNVPELAIVDAVAEDGRLLGETALSFIEGSANAEGRLELPSEMLNQIALLRIRNEASAGATVLLDEGWRRRPVGIVTTGASQAGHPLLDELHYVSRAMAPISDVSRGELSSLLEGRYAVIVVPDAAGATPEQEEAMADWVQQGGMLIRFAGPRLAESGTAPLPVEIRRGGRALGGALSWSQPQRLASFPPSSPFAGLEIPDDVRVTRQVLAEPSIDLAGKTWASLEDGTPLVTAERSGKGWLVLVHTTANADWSNLALSGLFVQMLQRMAEWSQGVPGSEAEGILPAVEVMDGFGRLSAPERPVTPLDASALAETEIAPDHPPGYYGSENSRRALNLSSSVTSFEPLPALPPGVARHTLDRAEETDLRPWLLLAAVLLGMLDLLLTLMLRGNLSGTARPSRRTAVGSGAAGAGLIAFLVGVQLLTPPSAGAQEAFATRVDERALKATLDTRLAYVLTGDAQIDETSRAGLQGLTWVLEQRTSVEAAEPMAVDPDEHELAFFQLLYWPVTPTQPDLSPSARERLTHFLENGGTILFDTRDQGSVVGNFSQQSNVLTAEGQRLRELLSGIDVPPLGPVPPDHVLTRSFYLLHEFPGRWAGGTIWLESAESGRNDGVSSVMIGGNDWAAAWAMDANGQPIYPVIPGGETQREMAYRFGVNLVMHVLTGNYKADQVHVPAILQRLGE